MVLQRVLKTYLIHLAFGWWVDVCHLCLWNSAGYWLSPGQFGLCAFATTTTVGLKEQGFQVEEAALPTKDGNLESRVTYRTQKWKGFWRISSGHEHSLCAVLALQRGKRPLCSSLRCHKTLYCFYSDMYCIHDGMLSAPVIKGIFCSLLISTSSLFKLPGNHPVSKYLPLCHFNSCSWKKARKRPKDRNHRVISPEMQSKKINTLRSYSNKKLKSTYEFLFPCLQSVKVVEKSKLIFLLLLVLPIQEKTDWNPMDENTFGALKETIEISLVTFWPSLQLHDSCWKHYQ